MRQHRHKRAVVMRIGEQALSRLQLAQLLQELLSFVACCRAKHLAHDTPPVLGLVVEQEQLSRESSSGCFWDVAWVLGSQDDAHTECTTFPPSASSRGLVAIR